MKGIILLVLILLLIFIPSIFLNRERDINLEKYLNYTKCNKYKVSKKVESLIACFFKGIKSPSSYVRKEGYCIYISHYIS